MILRFALLVIALTMFSARSQAQSWLDKTYSYDTIRNIEYGKALDFNGEQKQLRMDLWRPRCSSGAKPQAAPLLLWIHGGAFVAGNKEDASIVNLCQQFARRGYVTVSLDYRLGFISDSKAWSCNYPNYSCVFAADTAEWYRAWYRGVQDAKGALRYLVHHANEFGIDTANVFVAGESAGAFIALGAAFLDSSAERPIQTYKLGDLAAPASSAAQCVYNSGRSFQPPIARPDLGDIDGDIERDVQLPVIKAVGNNYGGMIADLLRLQSTRQRNTAIYSFHQPCDLVVPIDSGRVYEGLSWCMTNGYGCYGIAQTPKVYGSRAISTWNKTRGYNYTIHDEFTATNFPYNFVLGPGSCLDQSSNPCHAYDNSITRENNLATFLAPMVTSRGLCDSVMSEVDETTNEHRRWKLYPQPAHGELHFCLESGAAQSTLQVVDLLGRIVLSHELSSSSDNSIDISQLSRGAYFIALCSRDSRRVISSICIVD